MFSFIRTAKKHKVDYCGDKNFYRRAKDAYPAGKKVRLEYFMIATDTNYCFYLDDEPLRYEFKNEQFIIEFIMPDRDVKLRCGTVSTAAFETAADENDEDKNS